VSAREPDPPTPPRAAEPAARPAAADGACHDLGAQHCVTCADEGTPMRVLALHPRDEGLARCAAVDGIPVTVETTLVGALEPGAIVLVHAGVALARLDLEWGL
jgi:hydrogenase maturation factor